MELKRFIGPALAVTAVASCIGASVESEPPIDPGTEGKYDEGDETAPDGAALYATYCATCHGADGEGYAADHANALANQEFLKTSSDDHLRVAIEYGRPGTPMPSWAASLGGPLDPVGVEAIVAFMRTWQTETSVDVDSVTIDGDATDGETVYRSSGCGNCHGARGQGGYALSLNNAYFLATASDGYLAHAIANGRPGTSMPAYESRLSETELGDLVGFIRSWAVPVSTDPVEPPAEPTAGEIVINPDGPVADLPLRDGLYVAADDLKAAMDAGSRMVLIDARPISDWMQFHIPGALPFPFYDIEAFAARLPRDGTPIVAYCGCPHHLSTQAATVLRQLGFANTAVLDEGVWVWGQRGYPLVAGR